MTFGEFIEAMDEIVTADEFLDMCDLDQWARERRLRPTLAELTDDLTGDDYDG